jgi:hypothetical protein
MLLKIFESARAPMRGENREKKKQRNKRGNG